MAKRIAVCFPSAGRSEAALKSGVNRFAGSLVLKEIPGTISKMNMTVEREGRKVFSITEQLEPPV